MVSGFSGSGKGTIMKELMKKYADSYALSISATTRNPRPGETDGVEYFFRTKEQFEQMIKDDALIEYCLLYTSPSPRDTERSRMPSSA